MRGEQASSVSATQHSGRCRVCLCVDSVFPALAAIGYVIGAAVYLLARRWLCAVLSNEFLENAGMAIFLAGGLVAGLLGLALQSITVFALIAGFALGIGHPMSAIARSDIHWFGLRPPIRFPWERWQDGDP